MGDVVKFLRCRAIDSRLKSAYPDGLVTLESSKAMSLASSGKVEILHDMGETGNPAKVLILANYKSKLIKPRVVYTAIFGNKDTLPKVNLLESNWDFVVFTDTVLPTDTVWKIVKVDRKYPDCTRCAREFKMTPHELFPRHTVSVWVDGNIDIRKNVEKLFSTSLKDTNFCALTHPEKVQGIYHEGQRCIKMNKDVPQKINPQLQKYRKDGFPEKCDIIWTAVLVRKHNKPDVVQLDEAWIKEIRQHSRRDQISFPYVARKLKFKYKKLSLEGQWLNRRKHQKTKPVFASAKGGLYIPVIIPYGPNKKLGESYNKSMAFVDDWVVFLDHDVLLGGINPLWHDVCCEAIKKVGHKAGWITCYTNRIRCPYQKLKNVDEKNDDINYHRRLAKDLFDNNRGQLRQLDPTKSKLSGFFILTHKSAWKKVGGFKTSGFFGVDNAYHDALHKAGYKFYLMPDLYVYHGYFREVLKPRFAK